jgi:hypothetical protein
VTGIDAAVSIDKKFFNIQDKPIVVPELDEMIYIYKDSCNAETNDKWP